MAKTTPGARNTRTSVKGPLIFSAVLAVVAGAGVLVFSTGGSEQPLRWDLGVTAAGIIFIVTLVIAAMLSMTEKPNADHLGKGSGINLSSAKIRGGAANAQDQYDQPLTGRDADGSIRRTDAEQDGNSAAGPGAGDQRWGTGVDHDDETPGPLHPPKA